MEVTLPLEAAAIVEAPAAPTISAILVVYNQAAALRRAVAALDKSKNREQLEILVVDCGSQDGSSQIDTEFPGITVLRLPHHLGATRAMNIGTRTAKNDFLFYLEPTVEVAPDTVSKLAERLDSDTDAVAVCPLLVDAEGRPVSRLWKIPNSESLAAACSGREMPSAAVDLSKDSVDVEYPGRAAILVRKQFIKGMNYFDERFGHFWADADLAMQIRRVQKKIRVYTGIRATVHPAPDPLEGEIILAADRILGAAAFLGKYNGFFSGLQFRFGSVFRALVGFRMGEVVALIGGQKLDGSQAG